LPYRSTSHCLNFSAFSFPSSLLIPFPLLAIFKRLFKRKNSSHLNKNLSFLIHIQIS
jgi:hypothetical protein